MDRLVFRWLAAVCLSLCASIAIGATLIPNTENSDPAAVDRLEGAALIEALRGGGYVVYFRHTATDFSKADAAMKNYDDCASQRMLSAKGRQDAMRIGHSVRALKLAVGEVVASPYCRTMETARLAFKHVMPRSEIREGDGGDYPGLKQLLSTPVTAGTNRWMVGHGIPFRSVAGPPQFGEGEAVVIRPEQTHWTVVARIAPDDWAKLSAGRSARPVDR